MDYDDLGVIYDDEGQYLYTYNGHRFDADYAAHLIDAANGHRAPSAWTDMVLSGTVHA